MKKTIFIFLFSFFTCYLDAQVTEYISYQSASVKKNNAGEFPIPNEWVNKKMKILLDLDNKRLQLFSTDLLGQNADMLEQEIQLYKLKAKLKNSGGRGFALFTGTDKSGEKCIVSFKIIKKIDDIYDGMLQIEYQDTQSAYKIRKVQT